MTASQKKFARVSAGVLATLALLAPVTVSQSQGIDGNEACANGSCCRELNSICQVNGEQTMHHYLATGPCTAKR